MTDEQSPRPAGAGESILDSIAQRVGRAPQVNLRDAGTGDEAPILDPKAHSFQNELSTKDQGKYRILGEIARGGMGVVLRGHDVELGRDIAIKVTDAELAKRPEVIERFVEEAQIGGQLQHPGIVPVYELGLMADQRPYFTMKLIKGRTLAAMLTRRKSVEEDRVRFLGILESVCQTMAYAHSKGVIHRDLKPANIMVGAFGEVQVVDWGLSKVLRRGGVADEIEARDTALSVIETVRSGPGSGSASMIGSVLGTPAYMSPEQAQGEPDKLDERTDVFALGAILCEILTGKPPYVAGEGQNLVQMAALAELDDARARIEASSAAPDLKKLCQATLLTSRAARPRDAEEVATAVHEHLAGLETRAHEAQLAAAEERLGAERARRRSQALLAAIVVLALVGGGLWFVDGQRREREAQLVANFDAVYDEALAHQRDGRFLQAAETARSGLRLVEAGDASADLRERAGELVTLTEQARSRDEERLAAIERERVLFDFLLDVEMRQVRTGFGESDRELDEQYTAAFAAYGLDLEAEDVSERLAEQRDTDLGIRLALGFDGWSRLLRRMGSDRQYDIQLLTGIGIDVDTDPLRTELRWALVERDSEQLLRLYEEIDVATTAPETLALLGASLREFGHFEESRSVYVRGANRNPSSFLLNYGAGSALYELSPTDREVEGYESAVGYLRAALAERPDSAGLHVKIADLFNARGNFVQGAQHLTRAAELAPDHAWNAAVVGWCYARAGRFEEALEWYALDLADVNPGPYTEGRQFDARITLGLATLDEYVAWGEERTSGDDWYIAAPATALLLPGKARLEPDPARARAMLEPIEHLAEDTRFYWTNLAWACLELDDLPGAQAALHRMREADSDTPVGPTEALEVLRDAIIARRLGDHATADVELAQARWLRDNLVAGMEQEWSETPFLVNFRYFEPWALRN